MKRSSAALPLDGEIVCFTGALSMLRRDARERAVALGARVVDDVSRRVTVVFAGASPGGKLDRARDLGIAIRSEDDFLALVSASAASSSDHAPKKKRFVSDDPADIVAPSAAAASAASAHAPKHKRPKCPFGKGCYRTNPQHLREFSHSDDEADAPAPPPKSKKPKCPFGKGCYRTNPQHLREFSHSDDEADAPAPPPPKSKKKPKCPFGKGCYRTNPQHLREFSHSDDDADEAAAAIDHAPPAPAADFVDPDATLEETREEDEAPAATAAAAAAAALEEAATLPLASDDPIEPPVPVAPGAADGGETALPAALHEMRAGEMATVSGGKYTIKRVGEKSPHWYCTCPAWRNQQNPVDRRTCKHLREWLGDEHERIRCGGASSSAKLPKRPAPALLLANRFDLDGAQDPTGYWLSEKLDGVRCLWDGRVMVSRLGNEFPAPSFFTAGLPAEMTLDGELWQGRGQFQGAVSSARSTDEGRWRSLVFEVFDAPSLGAKPFEERQAALEEHFRAHPVGHVRVVRQVRCRGREHLLAELRKVEAVGGEGLMLRKPGSAYEGARSATLLKLKSFHTADARVVGHEAGHGKYAGMTGALLCEMACGKRFKCGSGMSDRDRQHPPHIGAIVTYKCFELTEDGVPRFPAFVGERFDAAEPSDPPPRAHRASEDDNIDDGNDDG